MNPLHSEYCNCECPDTEIIQRIRDIHMRFWLDDPYCSECHSYEMYEDYARYPCPTIRALDGLDV